jgi:DNA-nicking Smr family endonuclease
VSPRRPRALSPEERRLWETVARFITPLKGRTRPHPPVLAGKAPPAPSVSAAKPKPLPKPAPSSRSLPPPPAATVRPVASPAPPAPTSLALERRLHRALRRGSAGVDAALDLHGMRQAEAHAALHGFLLRSATAGHRLVLVVTGKGPAEADAFSERGVLRRSVPRWLALPEMRRLVVGVEEAGRRHGGAGALYVRLRRP